MRLFLVRHGVTHYNDEGRFTGQADIPLSDLGARQAAAVGEQLAAVPFDAIVSSDLQRARETAREIARHHDLPVQEDPDIREVSLGEWENHTYAEIAARAPELVEAQRWNPGAAPPGGESFTQVWERASRAFERWYARYPRGTVVWVAHGGFIQATLCGLLGIELRHRSKFHCSNASLCELEVYEDYVALLRWNVTIHPEHAR